MSKLRTFFSQRIYRVFWWGIATHGGKLFRVRNLAEQIKRKMLRTCNFFHGNNLWCLCGNFLICCVFLCLVAKWRELLKIQFWGNLNFLPVFPSFTRGRKIIITGNSSRNNSFHRHETDSWIFLKQTFTLVRLLSVIHAITFKNHSTCVTCLRKTKIVTYVIDDI